VTKHGMVYSDATDDVKTYPWKSVYMPVLMYDPECISINNNNVK